MRGTTVNAAEVSSAVLILDSIVCFSPYKEPMPNLKHFPQFNEHQRRDLKINFPIKINVQ